MKGISGSLLDHGFGNGILSLYFSREGFDVYGVELLRSPFRDFLFDNTVIRDNFKFLIDEEYAIPFPDSFFNVIVSNQVLNFIHDRENIESVVREFFRISTPGGKIVVTIMSEDNYLFIDHGVPPIPLRGVVRVSVTGRLERDQMYYRFEDSADVVSVFEKVGFVIDDLGYFDFKLLDVRCAKHYIVLGHKPLRE
ncbi:MAG: methyltransferase domain-containing protein [Propionivibrio sp.]|nr:methyltransferase domain-containing protein [Propionivibrio sp.]